MITEALIPLFQRDLDRLHAEITGFQKEKDLWKVEGGITNSAGNLCLHLCGNLQHFIGATLGASGYVRDREHEFSGKDIPREKLIEEIARTRNSVTVTLSNLAEKDLELPFPINVFGQEMITMTFLLHLQGHLNYHLGQINYLRRIAFTP